MLLLPINIHTTLFILLTSRYFTNQEISQLFELGNTSVSETCTQLEELHGAARNHSDQVKSDLKAIEEMGKYFS